MQVLFFLYLLLVKGIGIGCTFHASLIRVQVRYLSSRDSALWDLSRQTARIYYRNGSVDWYSVRQSTYWGWETIESKLKRISMYPMLNNDPQPGLILPSSQWCIRMKKSFPLRFLQPRTSTHPLCSSVELGFVKATFMILWGCRFKTVGWGRHENRGGRKSLIFQI